jgi:drug/metabolite transporter (DMT)-like permease
MYVVSKVVLDVVPPFALVSLRLLLGIAAIGLVIAFRGGFKASGRRIAEVAGTGLVGYGISLGFQFVGTKLSTAANGSLVTSATPAFVFLFAFLLLKEKLTSRGIVALVVSTVGVILAIDPAIARLEPSLFWGNLCLVAAALTWALYSVLIRKVTRDLDVALVSLIAFAGGLPLTIPLGVWELATQGLGAITLGTIGGILFLGIISTALAMYLWNTAFATLKAGTASLTFFAQPLVGTFLGWMLLGERITPLFLIGGALIGAGIILAATENK